MKTIKHYIFLLAMTLFSASTFAQQYQAPVTHSQWTFSGNKVGCYITHVIPQYGVGVFEQKSGERVNFILKAESYVPPIHTAMLSSVPPVWMHDAPSLKLAKVKTKTKELVVQSDVSERMLQELSNGRFPQFSYKANQGGQVNVAISSVNFLDVMAQFESCRQNLLPFSRDDVHQQLSLFNYLSTTITHKNRKLLSKAVTYVKEAGQSERIDLVSGTEDFSVKDGRRVYDGRVQALRQFLINEGMPEEQVIALDDPEALDTPAASVRMKVAGPEPFKHIYFRSGSVSLNERDNKKLDYLLQYRRLQHPDGKIVLKGYSDSQGPRQINMAVSKKRVEVIKKYLLSKGVKSDQIVTQAYGESRPTSSNRYPAGRQLNRRVDISISG
ncbi:OmpA family protein [Cycloclasticus pugetii]|uniref:OmpA family protein n=1 Tax=Cycloclasticus pugetii TaxID=34068 RepID=UPI00091FEE5A|nr:OmpA family protein [Cycloclasticus pugetii]SHI64682.1 Outer membrane protein OmpA [Cycloclasticus pugetii]